AGRSRSVGTRVPRSISWALRAARTLMLKRNSKGPRPVRFYRRLGGVATLRIPAQSAARRRARNAGLSGRPIAANADVARPDIGGVRGGKDADGTARRRRFPGTVSSGSVRWLPG